MTSFPRRDPVTDQLLTPENSALILIDYQSTQLGSVGNQLKSKQNFPGLTADLSRDRDVENLS